MTSIKWTEKLISCQQKFEEMIVKITFYAVGILEVSLFSKILNRFLSASLRRIFVEMTFYALVYIQPF